jgi:hypothetical protein
MTPVDVDDIKDLKWTAKRFNGVFESLIGSI